MISPRKNRIEVKRAGPIAAQERYGVNAAAAMPFWGERPRVRLVPWIMSSLSRFSIRQRLGIVAEEEIIAAGLQDLTGLPNRA